MAISTAQYIDLLVKKLVGVSKTDTNPPKAPSNESIASPPLLRGDIVWTQSDQIPATAQTVTGVVQSYLGGSSIQCTADSTVGLIGGVNPTWLTSQTDWIPPEFGSTWLVKVYAGPPSAANIQATGTQLFAAGSGGTGEYFFDNQAGLLNFIGNTIPASLTSGNVIYVAGYRYVGLKGTTNLPGNTTIGNLFFAGNTISSNVANGNITLTANGTGNVAVTGNISAQYLYGNGSQLTGIVASGGAQGTTGADGAQGTTGTTGAQGTSGTQGVQGTSGTQGIQGVDGAQGTTGVQGTDGAQGTAGTDGTSVTIIGSVATVGANPQATLNAAFPAAVAGNGAIAEDTGDLWVYDGATWSDVGQIQGPQGTTGAQGTVGADGAQGVQGVEGTQGTQGVQGTTGAQGVQGTIGSFDGNLTANLNGQGYSISNVSFISATGNIGGNYIFGNGSQLTGINASGGVVQSATAPSSPTSSTLWWDEVSGTLFVWYDDGVCTQWVAAAPSAGGTGSGSIIQSATAPVDPTSSTLWWDEVSGTLYVWYDDGVCTQWVAAAPSAGSAGGGSIIQSATAPADPTSSTLWWDEVSGTLYVWYNDGVCTQWVAAAPSAGSGSGSIIQSATAPVDPTSSTLWWDEVSGTLFVWYNDGVCTQWVAAAPSAGSGSGVSIVPNDVTYTDGSLYGNANPGFTVVTGDDDDEAYSIPVDFPIEFLGNSYSDGNVFLVSNSYLTFGPDDYTDYNPVGPVVIPVPAIFVGAMDLSNQKYYYGYADGTDVFVIGYEGSIDTDGQEDYPAIKWELQVSSATPDQITIVVDGPANNGGALNFPAGVWGISNGAEWIDQFQPLPWFSNNNDDTYNAITIAPVIPVAVSTIAFTGPGVTYSTNGGTTFINIDPFDQVISVGYDSGDAIISSVYGELTITTAGDGEDLNLRPLGDVNIEGGSRSDNQPGTGYQVKIYGGDAHDNPNNPGQDYYGGDIRIEGGSAVGDGAPGDVWITSNNNTWQFMPTGNLTLPLGGVVSENASPSGLGNTIALTPAGVSDADQQLLVYPTGNVVDGNHLHLTTGNLLNTELYLGNDDFYVKLANTGNIIVNTAGNTAQWTFDTAGNLTTPSNLVIGPGPGSGSRIFQYDEGLEIVGEGANSVVQLGWTANTSAPDSVTTIAMNYPGGGEGNILIAVGNNATTVNYWLFDNTGTLTLPGNTFAVNYANNTPVDVVTRFEGTWTVPTGNSTQSFTVSSGTYNMWVDCNIPNGILVWNATGTVTNTNVPVVGAQYAWVYNGGGTPIDFTSIPNQFTGTANTIVRSNVAPSATTNRFDFGINNTSGGSVTVRYGWIAIS
jgi:hypothetical protein